MITLKTRRVPVRALGLAAALLATACGDSTDSPSAAPAGPGPGGEPTFNVVQAVALAPSDDDRLFSAAFDGANRLHAAGWIADRGDQMMAVTRFNADGSIDTGFGSDGVATVNVAKGGKAAELARSVVVQTDGKVVVAGPVEHDPSAKGDAAKDTDIALARFDETGHIDPSFGTAGIVRLDLSTGVVDGTSFRGDTAWGLRLLGDGKLLVVGAQVGIGAGRTDTDFAVVRLTADGARDTTFGNNGVTTVGVGTGVSETPRTAVEVAGGKVVVTGYASVNGAVGIVMFRLDAAGRLDPSFGESGIAVRAVLGNVTEAYSIVATATRLITAGYGKDNPDDKVDLLVNGFTLDGTIDPTFGTGGLTRIDVAGDDDRARNLVALPDGRLIVVGSGKATSADVDGMVVRLTADGQLDTGWAPEGRKLTDVGGPNDSFFGVALSPDGTRAAVVGYLGRDSGSSTGDSSNDDGAVLWLQP